MGGGQLGARLSLPKNMENHREVPTTPTCCPVLCSHLGQALPSFGGSHVLPTWKLEVSGGRRSLVVPSKVMGEGWGSPCPGDSILRAPLARPPAGWPYSALGTNLLCPSRPQVAEVTLPWDLGVTRHSILGTWGSLQAPKVASRLRGGAAVGARPSLTMSVFSNAAAKSLLNKKVDGVKVRHLLGPGAVVGPLPQPAAWPSPQSSSGPPHLGRKGYEPSFSP